jgi:hypothetical protein
LGRLRREPLEPLPWLLAATLLDLLRFFLPWYAGGAFGMLGTRLSKLKPLRNIILSRPLDSQRDEGHAPCEADLHDIGEELPRMHHPWLRSRGGPRCL